MNLTPRQERLFSLHYFLFCVGVTDKYRIPSAISELVVLTDAGNLLLVEVKKILPDVDVNAVYFGFLLDLTHKEFWLDAEKTDIDGLYALFDHMLFTNQLYIPWIFGRDLYDNYHRLFTEAKKNLDEIETKDLLANSPKGVIQVGNLLAGPFGIVDDVKFNRAILNSHKIPLWHCSDTGCEALHNVEIDISPIPEIEIAGTISDIAFDLLGEGEDWYAIYKETFPSTRDYYNSDVVADIGAMLISCFGMVELRCLTGKLLISHSEYIRSKIKHRGNIKTLFQNSGILISSKLTKEQCLQIILLLNDDEIIKALEELIHVGEIKVPPEEIRSPKLGGKGANIWLGMYSEISQYGFRQVSSSFPDIAIAISRLRNLVIDFYETRGIPESSLMHLLRFQVGNTVKQKLDNYINEGDPSAVLKELISIHDKGLFQCVEYLKFGYAPPLRNSNDEDILIKKILWKLGFSVPLYRSSHTVFVERLDLLLKVSRSMVNSSESERDRARSAGVNLFVSLEEILDLALAYTSWLFLSDHFAITRLGFDVNSGRAVAVKYLNGAKLGSEKLSLRADGKNTLFPLIEGFSVLAKKIQSLRQKKDKRYLRDISGFPGHAGVTKLENFPFLHTMFLFDMDESELDACIIALNAIPKALRDGNVCDVRNRLEHKREDFPSAEEIEGCCNVISDSIDLLLNHSFYPMDYYHAETIIDKYGRRKEKYENSKGDSIFVSWPLRHMLSYSPPDLGPMAINKNIHIGDSSDIFIAKIVATSDYANMWQDYPKRISASVEDSSNVEAYKVTEKNIEI